MILCVYVHIADKRKARDDNQELEIKEKFKDFEEFKRRILNQKHYRADFDYGNLSESELKSKSILGIIEPDIGKNGVSVHDLISALPMVVKGREYSHMAFWSEMAGELNNGAAQYLVNIINKFNHSYYLGRFAKTELVLTFALKNEVAWNAFKEHLMSDYTVSGLNLLQALSKTKKVRDEVLPLMHQVFGKEFTDAYLENKELIDKTPRKGNFVDLLKENRYKITNFLDAFTDKVKILSEDFGENRYDYECLSKALEKEGFREAAGKLFATMLNEKEKYNLSYENNNSNAFIRKMFPELVEKLEENYTLNLTREKLEEVSKKCFKQAHLLRELYQSPDFKNWDDNVDGRLINDIMKAQPDNLEQIIKAYNIFYKINERPETYGSSYNSFYPSTLMPMVKRGLPDWMYPVVAKAVKSGVVSFDRLGNTENLFDAAKAWKINPNIWKKDAEKIGRMPLEARIVAGVIFDNISEQERDKTKQEKRELFWSEMKKAQDMSWKQAVALYGKDNIETKGRMLSLIFDNLPEDEFTKKLRLQLHLDEILNIKPERITEALNFISKDELLKEGDIASFIKKNKQYSG